jgi:fructose-1,6-bisphosphatase/inositol monophosphatase family enzyme
MVHWGVNVALRSGGTLEAGVVSLPPLGETLAAARGRGVTRNGRSWRPPPPGRPLREATVGLEIDGPEEWRRRLARGLGWVPACGQVNTFASAAYPIGLVCLGRLSALVIYGVEPVHLAAGAAIALELGLRVTDCAGAQVDWSGDTELPNVVCAWPEVHADLVAAMRAAR